MKSTLIIFFIATFVATAALAQTAEDDLIKVRNAAITKIKKPHINTPNNSSVYKIDSTAITDVQKRLRAIVGNSNVKPYPTKGKLAYETLDETQCCGRGFDALRFGEDGAPQVYVTTEALAKNWLLDANNRWRKSHQEPLTIDEAFGVDGFYAASTSLNAAFTKTISLPISKPHGADFAVASLGVWSQESGASPIRHIVVGLRTSGKVYIATEASQKFKPISACDNFWTTGEKKSIELFQNYKAGGSKDQTVQDAANMALAQAYTDYSACYTERLSNEPLFSELVNEAQGIANRFAVK